MSRPPPRVLAAASNWLAFAATLAVSFLLTPYLIRSLGPARYDVWSVVEAVLAYLTLLDLGIAACLVRQVARANATGDGAAVNRVAAASLAAFSAAGLAALLIGGGVLLALAGRLERAAGHPGDVLPFMLVMLVNLAASLPLGVFASVLDGLERYPEKSAVRVAALALRTVAVVLAVDAGGGLFALGAAVCFVSVLEQLALAGLCYRALPTLSVRLALVDRATLRLVRTSSVDAFLAMLAGRATVQTGAILAGVFLPTGSATAFSTGSRLVEYAKTLLRTVTATLTPGVSALEARGDWAGVRALYLGATRWVLYAAVPINLGLVWFGGPFLRRWVPDAAAGADPVAAVLAVTLAVGVAQSAASRVLYGLGRLRLFARLALAEAGLNLLLCAALIGPYGVTGVAAGVALPNVMFSVAVLAHANRQLGVPTRSYLTAWRKPLLAAAVPAAVWVLLGRPAAAWPAIVAAGAAGLAPYALAVLALELPAGARRRVRGLLAGRLATWSARSASGRARAVGGPAAGVD